MSQSDDDKKKKLKIKDYMKSTWYATGQDQAQIPMPSPDDFVRCLNCGAINGTGDEKCHHCQSPLKKGEP